MRDQGFVAQHRGGPLSKENHRQLMGWAWACSMHVMQLLGKKQDDRLIKALEIAKAWEAGKAATGDAMKASVAAHAAARESHDPVSVAIARSVGHAVATAHMADHSLGAALYALKAVHQAGEDTEAERVWQDQQLEMLTDDVVRLVHTNMRKKEQHFKM